MGVDGNDGAKTQSSGQPPKRNSVNHNDGKAEGGTSTHTDTDTNKAKHKLEDIATAALDPTDMFTYY